MNKFIAGILLIISIDSCQIKTMAQQTIRYVALGDSYTICTGAKEEESWPVLLTKHLKENNVDIELIANPSVNGMTTQAVIEYELPVLDKSKPTFVTLLIGTNDWVVGADSMAFQKRLVYIIEHIQKQLPDKNKLILITLPDFSVTPSGKNYSRGRDISKGISAFNKIIILEAKKRNLKIVDLYELSQKMGTDPDLVSTDGLHPSAKGYATWESLIFPVAYELLK
ncbi:MAG: SGNH/GDSL hydrolase family protein [Bacteroidetes bacterium]|nr:SGNH/GDSL hydrolase family protein [Bacteroidota bacterium]